MIALKNGDGNDRLFGRKTNPKKYFIFANGILFKSNSLIKNGIHLRAEFVPYYERAIKMVGMKYLDKTSNVREGISQRWQRVYFKDLRKSEDQDLDAAAARSKEVAAVQAVSPEFNEKVDSLIGALNNAHSERKMASNKVKEDAKS